MTKKELVESLEKYNDNDYEIGIGLS